MKFDVETVEFLAGLHSYMNTLVNTNEEILRLQLRKCAHFWGYREGNFVYYMFVTPWIRLYVVSAGEA